jgi:hypothetical protein
MLALVGGVFVLVLVAEAMSFGNQHSRMRKDDFVTVSANTAMQETFQQSLLEDGLDFQVDLDEPHHRNQLTPMDNIVPSLTPTRAPTAAPTFPPNYQLHPPPCINTEDDIAYVNGMISPTLTFYNCLANLGDPWSIPTFYNGTFNGLMLVYNSIQLNNLHQVTLANSFVCLVVYLFIFYRLVLDRCCGRNSYNGFLLKNYLARQSISNAIIVGKITQIRSKEWV